MPKIVCPDCKIALKGKYTIRVCPAGDTITRKYCEDCGVYHMEIHQEIRINGYENPDPYLEEEFRLEQEFRNN